MTVNKGIYTPSKVLDALRESFRISDGKANRIAKALADYKGIFMINGLDIDYDLQEDETTIKLEIKLR